PLGRPVAAQPGTLLYSQRRRRPELRRERCPLRRCHDSPGTRRGPYPPGGLDPEGLALTKDRDLILTSEGNTNTLLAPFVRRYDLAGDYLSDLPVPGYYLPTADHSSGIRFNLAFESAGVPPNGRFFFTATENALFQDGP